MQITVTFTPEEQAAIDTAVARQLEREPDLTAQVLIERMTLKVVRGWIQQERGDRVRAWSAHFEHAAKTATDAKVRDALAVLGVSL